MALSPATEWLEGVDRADSELRYLVQINDGATTWSALDGPCDQIAYSESVQSVSPIAVELDPLTREPQSGAVEIVLDDDWFRPLLVANRLKHQKCTIKLGAKEVAEGNFLSVFAGPIETIQPEAGKRVILEIEDVFTVLNKTEITGHWIDHPLAVIEDILDTKVGLPAAFWDATSLDPTQYSDIGHIQVARLTPTGWSVETSLTKPTPAFEVIAGLCRLLNGQLLADEDGKLTFVQFDSGASAVDDWDEDVIRPGTFEQDGDEGKVVNRFTGHFAQGVEGWLSSFQLDDATSQSNYAYPGMADRIITEEFETPWLSHYCGLYAAITDVGLSMTILGHLYAFSGTRGNFPGPQPANSTLAAARPAFLLLWDWSTGTKEIVKCVTAISFAGNDPVRIPDPLTPGDIYGSYYNKATYTIVRNQFSTGASAFPNVASTRIYDITALVLLGDDVLSRFKNEIHTVKLATGFGEYPKQLGDFLTLTEDKFLAYAKDGLSGTDNWEIVGKSADKYARPPRIDWTLAYAEVSAITGTITPGWNGLLDSNAGANALAQESQLGNAQDGSDYMHPMTSEGLSVTAGAGLVGVVGAGRASSGSGSSWLRGDTNNTFTASVDTWVIYSTRDGNIQFREEVTPSSKPTDLQSGEMILALVVTGVAAISSVLDYRTTTGIKGDRVDGSTISAEELRGETLGGLALNLNTGFNMRG